MRSRTKLPAAGLKAFLPHPKMPDMNLSRSEIANIIAYIKGFNLRGMVMSACGAERKCRYGSLTGRGHSGKHMLVASLSQADSIQTQLLVCEPSWRSVLMFRGSRNGDEPGSRRPRAAKMSLIRWYRQLDKSPQEVFPLRQGVHKRFPAPRRKRPCGREGTGSAPFSLSPQSLLNLRHIHPYLEA